MESNEKGELKRLRNEHKSAEFDRRLAIIWLIVHVVLTIVIAVWLMNKGASAKVAWLTGIAVPSFVWWLVKILFFGPFW